MIWTQEMLEAVYNAHDRRGTNNDCAAFIECRQNFASDHGTLLGSWIRHGNIPLAEADASFWYAVFSYGHHFPLAVYMPSADLWGTNFGGKSKRNHFDSKGGVSPTTRQHQAIVACSIRDMPQQEVGLERIRVLAARGPVDFITHRLEQAA